MTEMQAGTAITGPVETVTKKHPKPWLIPSATAVAALAVGFGLGAAVTSGGTATESPSSTTESSSSGGGNRDETAAASSAKADYETSAEDWAVDLTVTEKQCFGSAGCNVSVEPIISRIGGVDIPSSGTIVVRVSIAGDESGEIIETYRLDAATGSYDFYATSLSTPNGAVEPVATVTFAEYRAF